jgi:ABC-type antimicrobial peptide transport system permease subunit
MTLGRTLKIALRALRRNVMRAVLTTLGIMIGVGAVIAMSNIGQGSSEMIRRSVASMGANNLMVFPGAAASSGVSFGAGSAMTLTPQDCEAVIRDCPAVKAAAPVVRSRAQIVAGSRNYVPQSIYGTTPAYFEVRDWQNPAEGELFEERDVRNGSKVCVIGQTIAKSLFPGESSLGKEIRIRNVAFKIIGVLRIKGANSFGQDQDDIIVAPWTSIKARVSGSSLGNTNQSAAAAPSSGGSQMNTLSELYPSSGLALYPQPSAQQQANAPMSVKFITIDQIILAADSADEVQPAMRQVISVLRDRHRLRNDEADDFQVRDMADFSRLQAEQTSTMTNLLLIVALISLVVGGVGIMNIMLVSVTERTREIGLRMAVGARGWDIMWQFLVEALVLCLTGGAIGIFLGWLSSYLVTRFLGWSTLVSPIAIVVAVLVSAGVGLVFGFYPAWKASRLDPIEALRYE